MYRLAVAIVLCACGPGLAGAAEPGNGLGAAGAEADPATAIQLAIRYEHAEGVPRDLEKARGLYCMAARRGDPEGQFRLGWIYANGRGVMRDDGAAAALFGLAAGQGHAYASKMLRFMPMESDWQLPECMRTDPSRIASADAPEAQAEPESPGPGREDIERLVRQLAPRYSVDPLLALAVISAESAFNPLAISPKKAQGLMQLMPGTAERFGVKQPFDPVENLKGGLAYLRWLLAYFEGDVQLALAGYNAGERAVERYRGIPPYAETRAYIRKITGQYGKSLHPFDPATVEPSLLIARMKRVPD